MRLAHKFPSVSLCCLFFSTANAAKEWTVFGGVLTSRRTASVVWVFWVFSLRFQAVDGRGNGKRAFHRISMGKYIGDIKYAADWDGHFVVIDWAWWPKGRAPKMGKGRFRLCQLSEVRIGFTEWDVGPISTSNQDEWGFCFEAAVGHQMKMAF